MSRATGLCLIQALGLCSLYKSIDGISHMADQAIMWDDVKFVECVNTAYQSQSKFTCLYPNLLYLYVVLV